MYEEALFHLLNRLHERYREDALAPTGKAQLRAVRPHRFAAASQATQYFQPDLLVPAGDLNTAQSNTSASAKRGAMRSLAARMDSPASGQSIASAGSSQGMVCSCCGAK